jgi:uncharacterized membrane protein YebE (DUF533 family)
MAETKLGKDVFLALAAVGWADGKLGSDEADAIVRCALDEGLELEEISAIEEATKKPLELDDIDVSRMSKADRLFVYAVATWIVRIDGDVAPAETDALARLGDALKIPAKPREHASTIAAEIGNQGESDKAAFYNLPKLRRTLQKRLEDARNLRQSAANED